MFDNVISKYSLCLSNVIDCNLNLASIATNSNYKKFLEIVLMKKLGIELTKKRTSINKPKKNSIKHVKSNTNQNVNFNHYSDLNVNKFFKD